MTFSPPRAAALLSAPRRRATPRHATLGLLALLAITWIGLALIAVLAAQPLHPASHRATPQRITPPRNAPQQ